MNMVIEFLNTLLRIPSKGYMDIRFLAVKRADFDDSTMSASRIFRGRKSDIIRFPAPRTRKLRRPYSLLRVWTTTEFSPNLVVWRTISPVFLVISCGNLTDVLTVRTGSPAVPLRYLTSHDNPQTFSFSHAAIARRAFPLCEMSFFCSSVMSASVSPGYSSAMNIGS